MDLLVPVRTSLESEILKRVIGVLNTPGPGTPKHPRAGEPWGNRTAAMDAERGGDGGRADGYRDGRINGESGTERNGKASFWLRERDWRGL